MALPSRRIRPSGRHPTLIRRALQAMTTLGTDLNAYTIEYKGGKTIGDELDDLNQAIDDLEGGGTAADILVTDTGRVLVTGDGHVLVRA